MNDDVSRKAPPRKSANSKDGTKAAKVAKSVKAAKQVTKAVKTEKPVTKYAIKPTSESVTNAVTVAMTTAVTTAGMYTANPTNAWVVATTPVMEFLDFDSLKSFIDALPIPEPLSTFEMRRRGHIVAYLIGRIVALLFSFKEPTPGDVQEAWTLCDQVYRLATKRRADNLPGPIKWERRGTTGSTDEGGEFPVDELHHRQLAHFLLPTIFFVSPQPEHETNGSEEIQLAQLDAVVEQRYWKSVMSIFRRFCRIRTRMQPHWHEIDDNNLPAFEEWSEELLRRLVEHPDSGILRHSVQQIVITIPAELKVAFRYVARVKTLKNPKKKPFMQFSLMVMDGAFDVPEE
jgi:hypothetical protein